MINWDNVNKSWEDEEYCLKAVTKWT